MNTEFWSALEELVAGSEIIIDRPKRTVHPRFPSFIYPVDYGYLKDTRSMDGAESMFGWAVMIESKSMLLCVLSTV